MASYMPTPDALIVDGNLTAIKTLRPYRKFTPKNMAIEWRANSALLLLILGR
jgi:hypothetical protein